MANEYLYKDESKSFEERARDLVSRMTLEEKVRQMLHKAPAIDRLGILRYTWWGEALHGVARAGVATMFPQAIAMAATFDKDLLFTVADIVSTEARAKFHEFQRKKDYDMYKGLTMWSPNINIFRDPRWGRGHETYGEDPYLTSILGVAYIKGLQGNDEKYLKTAACAKHFAVHSGPEELRHSFNAIVSKKDLWETYLPAFEVAVKDADVESVMGAYNRTNGEPCCGSKMLLVDILREKWQFKGHVVSDCMAIKDFHENHHVTSTAPESVALAVKNGCDLNCGNMYVNLLIAHQEGLVTEEDIDRCVTRLMVTRMKLGLFDNNAQVPYANIKYEVNDCKEHHDLAMDVAKRSLILLKNKNNILPLDKNKLNSIAVIGPNADSRIALLGNYFGTPSKHITILEGIRDKANNDTRVYYAEGCHLHKDRMSRLSDAKDGFAEAISAAEHSDVVIMCMGLDSLIEGEEGDATNEFTGGDKINLNLPGVQQDLLEEIHKTGKPVILVLISGSAINVSWADENIPAIIQAFYPGAEGGAAIASMIFGEYSPSARLPVTFYRTTEELPDFQDYSMENRTYRYMKNEALYPFGYGLSYTKFEYSNMRLNKHKMSLDESIELKVDVKNTGKFDSYEVVQLYIKDLESSVRVPNLALKGVEVVYLKKGEEKEVNFTIIPDMLGLIDYEGNKIFEAGIFKVFIGGSQPDKRSIELTGRNVLVDEIELL